MSAIRTDVQEKLKNAMKSGDKVSLLVYRNLISEFKKWEVDNIKTLTDVQALDIIRAMVKQRDQSIEAYQQANRQDLLEPEIKEKAVLTSLLPQQLSEDEVRKIIKDTFANLAPEARNMGGMMKAVQGTLKGRADNKLVSTLVQECLKN